MIRLSIFFLVGVMLTSLAHADILEQTARNEHMRRCLGSGGQKEICLCSFDKAKSVFSTEDLLDLNRRLSSRMAADPDKVKLLQKITIDCVEEIQSASKPQTKSASQAVAIPLPPSELAPPAMQPEPPKVEELKPQIATKPKPSNAIKADETNVPEREYLTQTRAKNQKLNSAHYDEYHQVFLDSIATGNIQGLIASESLIKDFNKENEHGYTPLMIAAMYGQPISTEFLLERKAKVNKKNKLGQSAIHLAAYKGHTEVLQILLDKDAKINEAYGPGYQPIHLATLNGSTQAIDLLLASGADINAKMNDGNQPIHLAIASRNPNLITYMHSKGANIEATNNAGQTPLIIATYTNRPYAVENLLMLGANYFAIDAAGRNAAIIAQENGYTEIINIFLTQQERIRLKQYGIMQ